VGTWSETRGSYNPITMGLPVRQFRMVPATRASLLGFPEPFDP
jgi:hypothetical protein